MAKVSLREISKQFPDGTVAVNQVSMEIEDGEFLVLVGPSGCGKTTTLRLIAGLEQATSGSIWIGEREVTALAPKDRDVSMVFQNYALWPHISVRQNLSFGLRLRGGVTLPRMLWARCFQPGKYRQLRERAEQIDRQVDQTAATLGIAQLLHRKPRELSGGQRQRVAVGRALVRHPKAFLFDEPLSNLDAKLRVEMRRELRRLHADLKATMIYVTHDQIEAMTLGNRIAVMDHGQVKQLAPPLEIYDRPVDRFVAGFVGSPPMNLLEGQLLQNGDRLEFRSSGLAIPLEVSFENTASREVCLGFRPEHAYLENRHQPFGPAATLEGTVSLVEPLGDESIVHVDCPGVTITSKIDAHLSPNMGERAVLGVPYARMHLFDTATGRRLN